jgi:YHYH protein
VKGAGDLDECNGRVGVTPEFPGGTYHYYLTSDFPFIPRLYRGTPDSSFERHGPPGGPNGGRPGGGRPPGGPGGPPPERF